MSIELRDGTKVRVRPIRAGDKALLEDGLARLSAETVTRIREIATSLEYRPDPVARMLAQRRTWTIGILTPQALDVDFARYPSSRRVSCLRRSRLHHVPAGSPTLTGRIEFVILRMDRSPPVAPHPALRRRSYSWLQAGERIPEEDFHLSD